MSAVLALPVRRAVLTVVGVAAVLQSLMVLAFAWPAGRTAPRDVPVVVTGPSVAADRFAAAVDRGHPGALHLSRVADDRAARAAVQDRTAYGALLLDGPAPRVLVTSAASPAVAQLLTSLAGDLGRGDPVEVDDVVPAPPDDPRGAVLSAMVLPLVMTSVIGGAGLALLVRSVRARAVGAVALAGVGALAVTTIAHVALGGLDGSFPAEAGVVALMVLAVTGTVAGAGSVGGHLAVVPAAMTMMLLGNPLSGASSAPELLPRPWGALGQMLPPGAGSQALRSVAFFDGAAAGSRLLVLLAWVAFGALLIAVADRRDHRRPPRRTDAAEAPSPQDALLPA